MGLSMPQHEEDNQLTSLVKPHINQHSTAMVKWNQPHSLSPPEGEIRKPFVGLSIALHLCCLLEKSKDNS